VKEIFAQEVTVQFHQVYVESRAGENGVEYADAFAGQRNGLLGAATPGALHLVAGPHTATVDWRVQLSDTDPEAPEAGWQEVVEASFTPATDSVRLVQWAGTADWPLPLPRTSLRVRYSMSGMEATGAHQAGRPRTLRCLLQFWPAEPQPDVVVRETSAEANVWHRAARRLPAPSEAREEDPEVLRGAVEWAARLRERARGHGSGAGRRSGEAAGARSAAAGGRARKLAALDPSLPASLEAASPRAQRDLARWAARRACEVAGLDDVPAVNAALRASEEGHELPEPLRDPLRALAALTESGRIRRTSVETLDGRQLPVSQQAMALAALAAASGADALRAASDALYAAARAYGPPAHRDLLAAAHRRLA
jgi:hypothetical protein